MYAMIVKIDLMKLIGDLEILVLITSCICHDLDHPGYNNIYQVTYRIFTYLLVSNFYIGVVKLQTSLHSCQ